MPLLGFVAGGSRSVVVNQQRERTVAFRLVEIRFQPRPVVLVEQRLVRQRRWWGGRCLRRGGAGRPEQRCDENECDLWHPIPPGHRRQGRSTVYCGTAVRPARFTRTSRRRSSVRTAACT